MPKYDQANVEQTAELLESMLWGQIFDNSEAFGEYVEGHYDSDVLGSDRLTLTEEQMDTFLSRFAPSWSGIVKNLSAREKVKRLKGGKDVVQRMHDELQQAATDIARKYARKEKH